MSDIKKLRWRCRRGTLELDLMLMRYLDTCYQNTGIAQQQAFLDLLDLEDPALMRYLMGDERPDNPVLVDLVDLIRKLPA